MPVPCHQGIAEKEKKSMKKNKYDLAEDVAWLLSKMENCKGCFMKKECKSNSNEEKVLCSNVSELTQVIEKKYLR